MLVQKEPTEMTPEEASIRRKEAIAIASAVVNEDASAAPLPSSPDGLPLCSSDDLQLRSRGYQLEMFEISLRQNSIIAVPDLLPLI